MDVKHQSINQSIKQHVSEIHKKLTILLK